MPLNPSELFRLEEERKWLLQTLTSNQGVFGEGYKDKGRKSAKEALLRDLRAIEAALGIESKPYNSPDFGLDTRG
jgi:hypothetical protein